MGAKVEEIKVDNKAITDLFEVGAHYGYGRSRRHPSVGDFIFGSKNKTDIFDLEKTSVSLESALEYIKKLGESKGTLLFVGGKNEAREIVKNAAEKINMPYVAGRWIGGSLTNFPIIRKRVDTMLSLKDQMEKGELAKYTKKERLMISRDIERLDNFFHGLVTLTSLPKALFIVDPRKEDTALKEAKKLNIPVVALCGSDNNIKTVDHAILGNDSARKSIEYFVNQVATAYEAGVKLSK
jgi:small subunit ribosomal protein S2